MKRFWDYAACEPQSHAGAWRILLDGKPVRLPSGTVLSVRHAKLAEAVAAEWQAAGGRKGGEMSFADVPLTRLAGTAQERIAADVAPVVAGIAEYGASDLLCYRASAPDLLVEWQARAWQPWLDWAADTYRAPLTVTQGVMPVRQDPQSLCRLARAVEEHSPDMLAALGIVVPALGSLVLGLAMAAFRLPAAAHELASLDELFQAELWGEDEQAAARRRGIAADVALAGRFMALSVA